jgi:multiple sugar transport system permease protein
LLGGTPLSVLVLYWAFRRIPREQWDQAQVDGAGPMRMWWFVGLPQVQRMLIALGALVFLVFWGNFIDPLLYLTDSTWQTLPVGLQALQQLIRSDWPVLMAGAVVATLPPLMMFIFTQRVLLDPFAVHSKRT